MDLPFTREQFFGVFANYNDSIFPLQIFSQLFGIVAALLAFWGRRKAGQFALGFTALFWLLTGIGYHVLFFAKINPAAYLFGAIFVVQAVLLAGVALRLRAGSGHRSTPAVVVGLTALAYGLVVYPILSLIDHGYPACPLFGVTPCPTTIFTVGLLLVLRAPRYLLVVPVLWSVVGGSAAVLLSVPEDYGLIAAGVVGATGFFWLRRRPSEGMWAQGS